MESEGKDRCLEGELEPIEGKWEYNGTVFIDVDDCYAEQDMQFGVQYLIVLLIIGLKFFFGYVLWTWYRQSVLQTKIAVYQKRIEIENAEKNENENSQKINGGEIEREELMAAQRY